MTTHFLIALGACITYVSSVGQKTLYHMQTHTHTHTKTQLCSSRNLQVVGDYCQLLS